MTIESSPNRGERLPQQGAGARVPALTRLLGGIEHVPVAGAVATLAAWAVLTGLLVACGKGIEHIPGIRSADENVTNFVVAHRTPALTELMKVVTWAGTWTAVLVVAVAVAVLAWRRRLSVIFMIAVVAAWVGELLAVTLTKSVVQRPRPPEAVWLVVAHGWSFPSGHAANAVVVFATAAAVLSALAGRRFVSVVIWMSAALGAALIAFSRIELGVHWMSDVLASMVFTVMWVLIVATAFRVRESGYAFSTSNRAPVGIAGVAPSEIETLARHEDRQGDGGGRLVHGHRDHDGRGLESEERH